MNTTKISRLILYSMSLIMASSTYGQFDKYKSPTQFNPPGKTDNKIVPPPSGTEESISPDPSGTDMQTPIAPPPSFTGGDEDEDSQNTDIMDITKHMQKLTGINLILDKDVKGKVTILSPSPITVGDAWKAYL